LKVKKNIKNIDIIVWEFVVIYIDDLIVNPNFSASILEHFTGPMVEEPPRLMNLKLRSVLSAIFLTKRGTRSVPFLNS
jgi:hypothetical protein